MKLNINQIDLLQNLTKVENNTFWEFDLSTLKHTQKL